jgi:hypothetical protein
MGKWRVASMFKQILLGEQFTDNELKLIEKLSEEELNRLEGIEKRWFRFVVFPIFMVLGALPMVWFTNQDSRSVTDWIVFLCSILLMIAFIRLAALVANESVKRALFRSRMTRLAKGQ